MSRTIDFAVLTKSDKFNGWCVAGINWETGKFIRLVSQDTKTHGAIDPKKFTYSTGKPVACLDLIKVKVLGHDNNQLQPENLILDENENIEFIDKLSLNEVLEKHPADNDQFIFVDSNERLIESNVKKAEKSLLLVKVTTMTTYPKDPGKRFKSKFYYNGIEYNDISITDPKYAFENIEYDSAYIVISLGAPFFRSQEPFHSYYKLIAAIYNDDPLLNAKKYYNDEAEDYFTIDEHILESLNLNQNNMLNELATKSIDTLELKRLDIDDNSKIENISLLYKNIKKEIDKLAEQKSTLTQNLENLRNFLSDTLAGKAYHSQMVNITYRNNDSIEFNEEFIDLVPKEFLRIDKAGVRKALKNGQNIPGCELTTKQSLSIKVKE